MFRKWFQIKKSPIFFLFLLTLLCTAAPSALQWVLLPSAASSLLLFTIGPKKRQNDHVSVNKLESNNPTVVITLLLSNSLGYLKDQNQSKTRYSSITFDVQGIPWTWNIIKWVWGQTIWEFSNSNQTNRSLQWKGREKYFLKKSFRLRQIWKWDEKLNSNENSNQTNQSLQWKDGDKYFF